MHASQAVMSCTVCTRVLLSVTTNSILAHVAQQGRATAILAEQGSMQSKV